MFCQKCGGGNKDGAIFCNSCGTDLRLVPVPADEDTRTRHNKVISAKIATKREELKSYGQTGPAVLALIGLVLVLAVIGILILIIAVWWSYDRAAKATKIENEIKELEAELE
jgi:uncharacterized membrane protein YvbJ